MSPREYAARLDLLRVQDCLWARMKPTAIARKLGKDKAWVSRAIARIRDEQATGFQSPTERELTTEHLAQLDSLIAKAIAETEGTGKARLAALRVAMEALRQKSDYQLAIGLVQRREPKPKEGGGLGMSLESLREELPESAVRAILERTQRTEIARAQRRMACHSSHDRG